MQFKCVCIIPVRVYSWKELIWVRLKNRIERIEPSSNHVGLEGIYRKQDVHSQSHFTFHTSQTTRNYKKW
jgi:hypothetical protein